MDDELPDHVDPADVEVLARLGNPVEYAGTAAFHAMMARSDARARAVGGELAVPPEQIRTRWSDAAKLAADLARVAELSPYGLFIEINTHKLRATTIEEEIAAAIDVQGMGEDELPPGVRSEMYRLDRFVSVVSYQSVGGSFDVVHHDLGQAVGLMRETLEDAQ